MKTEKINAKRTTQKTNGALSEAAVKPKKTASRETPPPVAIQVRPAAENLTVVEARIDVGFGNQLYIRGMGAGLSWEHGVPLGCVDATTWRWAIKASEPVTFKLLLNDQLWCQGSDLRAAPGTVLEVAPAF